MIISIKGKQSTKEDIIQGWGGMTYDALIGRMI